MTAFAACNSDLNLGTLVGLSCFVSGRIRLAPDQCKDYEQKGEIAFHKLDTLP